MVRHRGTGMKFSIPDFRFSIAWRRLLKAKIENRKCAPVAGEED